MQVLPEPLAPMASCAQFILFKLVPRGNGKTDKLPVDHRTLKVFQKGNDWQQDAGAWTTFANASFLAAQLGPEYGVGFFFTPADPFFFLDIDKCLIDGAWSPTASDVMARLPGAAIEVSQSGKGLHIFGKYAGAAPEHGCTNKPLGLELYTESRFVALTGDRAVGDANVDCTANLASIVAMYFPSRVGGISKDWTTEPTEDYTGPEDDDELIAKALASGSTSASAAFGNGGSCPFRSLWEGNEDDFATYYPDEGRDDGGAYGRNEVDAALAQHLAFWTGKNCERIHRLMYKSAIVRDKWEREDYLDRTIRRAVGLQSAVYSVIKVDTTAADEMGAPKLKGSEAQQTFAASIRAKKLAEAVGDCEVIDRLITKHGPTVDAKWWLENQHETAEDLAALATPVSAALNPMSVTDGPELSAGYQFLGPEQQVEYFSGCVYVQDAHRVFIPSGALLKVEQVNATFGGYIFQLDDSGSKTTRKAFEAFTESQIVRYPKAESVCFRPDLIPGCLVDQDGQILLNTFVPLSVDRMAGDASPFLKHLTTILPDPHDQAILLAYMAACVQHPGVKFQWAPLIQGVEGNGKTLFTRCVAAAVGRKYTHLPKASEIGEKFNEWLFDKIFIGVEDIYVPDQKREVWEILKPMITGEWQPCRAMQRSEMMRECCSNFIFNANEMAALRKTENDRRVAPFFCAQQQKSDLVKDGLGGGYFQDLYGWLKKDGYAVVSEYLFTYPIPDALNPALGHTAPETSSTNQAITAGLGGVEQEVLEAIDEGRVGFAGGWISSMALEKLLNLLKKGGAIPPNKRRELLQSLGYDWHPALKNGRVNNTIMPDGGKPRLFILKGHISANLSTPAEAVAAYQKAQGAAVDGAVGSASEAFGR